MIGTRPAAPARTPRRLRPRTGEGRARVLPAEVVPTASAGGASGWQPSLVLEHLLGCAIPLGEDVVELSVPGEVAGQRGIGGGLQGIRSVAVEELGQRIRRVEHVLTLLG